MYICVCIICIRLPWITSDDSQCNRCLRLHSDELRCDHWEHWSLVGKVVLLREMREKGGGEYNGPFGYIHSSSIQARWLKTLLTPTHFLVFLFFHLHGLGQSFSQSQVTGKIRQKYTSVQMVSINKDGGSKSPPSPPSPPPLPLLCIDPHIFRAYSSAQVSLFLAFKSSNPLPMP